MSSAYKVLFLASLLSFLATFGIALPYPVLTPLMVGSESTINQWLGIDPKLLLGIVLAAYPLGMLLGANVIGSWSDHFGRRRVVMWTMAGALFGYALSVLAISLENYLLLLLSRLFTGFCEGNVAVFRAMAADLGDEIPRTKIFAWSMTATFLGWTFGPLCGGLLLSLGALWVFVLGALFIALGWLLVALYMTNSFAAEKKTAAPEQAFSLYRLADIRGFAFVHFIACMAINAFYEYFPLWLVEHYEQSGLGIAVFTLVLQIGMLASSIYYMRWFERRWGLIPSMHGSLAILGIGLVLIPSMPALFPTALLFMLIGLVNSTFFGTFMSEYSERFQHYGQGRILGLITFNFSLSALIMALFGAGLSLLGSAWVLELGGLMALLALAYLYVVRMSHPCLNPTLESSGNE